MSTSLEAENASTDLSELLPRNCKKYKVDKLLYLDRALNSWGDRCWEFAIGLYLIKLHPNSLLLTALQGILASCASIALLPFIGAWIAKARRLKEIAFFLFISNVCVAVAASFVALFFLGEDVLGPSVYRITAKVAPYMLVIFSSLEQVTSSGYTLSLEKDWILVIAEDDQQLSRLNASLRRIDLAIKTIAPLLIGLLIQYSDLASALFLLFYNCLSGFAEYLVMRMIYNEVPELSAAKMSIVPEIADNASFCENEQEGSEISSLGFFHSISTYIKHYGLPGISYSLMHLSVLNFDSITVGFVKSTGVSETIIGLVSVLSAASGIIGTLIFQLTIKHFNLKKILTFGYLSDLIPQLLTLVLVIAPHHRLGIELYDYDISIVLFLTGMTLANAGLWITDLSNNQLIQTTTPEPALIGGIQISLNTTAELIKFILAAYLSNLSQFYILIIISIASTTISTLISCFYTVKTHDITKNDTDPDE